MVEIPHEVISLSTGIAAGVISNYITGFLKGLSVTTHVISIFCYRTPFCSLFNVFVPAKKGYCLCNTLHESVLFCDEELKEALQTNVEGINPEFLPTLKTMVSSWTTHRMNWFCCNFDIIPASSIREKHNSWW